MTFSALISHTIPHQNKLSSRGGVKVNRIIQHHLAGMGDSADDRLINPAAAASANYVVYTDGDIAGQVPEEYRAWTSGSHDADDNSITIEVENISGQVNGNDNDPNSWKISAKAMASLIRLIADIATRHKFGSLTTGNYDGHREHQATACPGGYIWHKMDEIRAEANKKVGVKAAAPAKPQTKSIATLAKEVIAGKHGIGDARKKSLGSKYAAVQAEVNRQLMGVSAPQPKPKSVATLAKEVIAGKHGTGNARRVALGGRYAAVQAEVNRILAGRSSAPKAKSIDQLAREVIAGKHGNGPARKKSLGSLYSKVQARVNQLL